MATHWLGTASGPTFRDAARYLADNLATTVVTTTFSRGSNWRTWPDGFQCKGLNAQRVVTLLVEDTWGET